MSRGKRREPVMEPAAQASFWTQQLAGGLRPLAIQTDHPRPPVQAFVRGRERLLLTASLNASLERVSSATDVGFFVTLLTAFTVLMARHAGQDEVIVGSVSGDSKRLNKNGRWERFANPVALRISLTGDPSVRDLIRRVAATVEAAAAHRDYPFTDLLAHLPREEPNRSPIFQAMFVLANAPGTLSEGPIADEHLAEVQDYAAACDLSIVVSPDHDAPSVRCDYDALLFEASTVRRLLERFKALLEGFERGLDGPASILPLVTASERRQLLVQWNETRAPYASDRCIHEFFEAQVEQTPDAVAVACDDETISYRQLNRRANGLARRLRALGIGPDAVVGLCTDRTIEMLVGMLGILKAGGAYVPLDPRSPRERLAAILADSGAAVLVTQARWIEHSAHPGLQVLNVDDAAADDHSADADRTPESGVHPDNLAYVIYTSGSTGQPKGVMVEHRHVSAFFTGMDPCAGGERPGVWLALTSIAFDISVLELLWTLSRGFTVVLHAGDENAPAPRREHPTAGRRMEFSLFYFASEDGTAAGDPYRLLVEGARFADRNGFTAVWTPERHFHRFGGLFPNPSVTSALLAGLTERIHIRAGSVVLPLHSPIRVVEEWAVVDHFSKGRIGVSFASGWHDRDFVFAPDSYAARKEVMRRSIDTVRGLWRGETLACRGGAGADVEIRIFPHPIQRELPIWVTAAWEPDTFRMAGEIGANVLTHLLFQSMDEIGGKIAVYREAWRNAGHGPGGGHVTLMLHTFVDEDSSTVREKARKPFCDYLKSSVDLLKRLSKGLGRDVDATGVEGEDLDALAANAFDRYFESSGLFGTPRTCRETIERLKAIGVDEVACLIDFGIDVESVLGSLEHLKTLKDLSNQKPTRNRVRYTIPELTVRHGVTHLQCTPSLATTLTLDAATVEALKPLRRLMVGGEALPTSLAARLSEVVGGEIWNMYGPTETTVWSTVHRVNGLRGAVPIGRPIANTEIYILDRHLEPTPVGIPGELAIGGAGVSRGYKGRTDLTANRFIPDPFSGRSGARLYRTGDLARYTADGAIEFLGRLDQQVKIRGCRIEPAEIEATLLQHRKLREAVVVARTNGRGERELAAYVSPVDREPPSARELRAFLLERLPDYMVPSTFVSLDSLPLTAGGKIDRRSLMDRPLVTPEAAQVDPPSGPVEELLADLWGTLLRTGRLSASSNFFELGGHSLLAMQHISRLRQIFGLELPPAIVFEAPTIRQLAAALVRLEDARERTERIAAIALNVNRMSGEEVERALHRDRQTLAPDMI